MTIRDAATHARNNLDADGRLNDEFRDYPEKSLYMIGNIEEAKR